MGTVVLGIRVVLAAVFAVAGIAKLLDRDGSRRSLAGFGVPERFHPVVVWALPLTELAIAIALVPADASRWAAGAAALLLLAFVAGISRALARGRAPDCHCFGQLHSAPAGRSTLVRNATLAALAGVVVVEGQGPEIGSWVSARTAAELVAVAAVASVIGLGWLAASLWRERRDLRAELAGATGKLAELPDGLPVGAIAPSFALEDVHGNVHTLDSLLARGNPVLLVFVHPDCGPCVTMLPELARWQTSLAHSLTVAPISLAFREPTRAMAAEHGIELMLVGEDTAVLRAFEAHATPTALIVAPDGTVASSAVSTLLAIEPLVRLTLQRERDRQSARSTATSSQR